MILVKNVALVLQKTKQVKSRVDLNGARVGTKNGIASLSRIGTLNDWVAARRCDC